MLDCPAVVSCGYVGVPFIAAGAGDGAIATEGGLLPGGDRLCPVFRRLFAPNSLGPALPVRFRPLEDGGRRSGDGAEVVCEFGCMRCTSLTKRIAKST